jgi:hypothetical protein
MSIQFINTITADSTPVLDTWGWGDFWNAQDWQVWHSKNVVKYGKAKANEKFVNFWNSQSIDANPYNWAKYDTTFRAYLKQWDLLSAVTNVVADVLVGATDVISGGVEAVGDISEGVGATAKTFKMLLPIVLIIAAYILLTTFKKRI